MHSQIFSLIWSNKKKHIGCVIMVIVLDPFTDFCLNIKDLLTTPQLTQVTMINSKGDTSDKAGKNEGNFFLNTKSWHVCTSSQTIFILFSSPYQLPLFLSNKSKKLHTTQTLFVQLDG